MSKIIPFFINSNLCTDENDIINFENFRNAIAHNIGNSYITWALIKQLQGGFVKPYQIKNIWKYDFSKQDKDIDIINNKCTHVFLILQDQIRIVEGYNQLIPFENLIKFISKINKKIIVLSLGINQYFEYNYSENRFIKTNLDPDFDKKLNKNLINFLKFLSDHTETIGIRGSYTQEILEKLGITNTHVIGCPTFYESGNSKIVQKKSFDEIKNILMLQPWLHSEYTNTFSIPGKRIRYIIQDEQYFLKKIFNKKVHIQEMDEYELINWKNHAYNTFSSIEDWKKFCRQQDFAFGYRIHGSIMATNNNLPVLFFAPDIKGTEMAQYLNIPYTHKGLNNLSLEDMYNMCDTDKLNSSYPQLYTNYKMFLEKNDLKLFNENNEKYDYDKQPSLPHVNITVKKYKNWFNFIFSINKTPTTKIFTILGIIFRIKRKKK